MVDPPVRVSDWNLSDTLKPVNHDPELGMLFDDIAGAGQLYALERLLWMELWRVPILEEADETGIEARHYGPIRVFANPHASRLTMFNMLLGADRPSAVAAGALAEALDWTESLGLDCRVPVRRGAEFGEAEAAEDQLNRRGYRRTGTLATFSRGLAPPPFEPSGELQVEELVDESEIEAFDYFLEAGYGLDQDGQSFFMGLPQRRSWRCYMASDEKGPLASAATMMHLEFPQLVFAGTAVDTRRRGAHLALLHRSIEDIRARCDARSLSRPRGIFAITEEALDCPETLSPGARNLVRAGFRLVDVRALWRPPEDLVADGDDAEEDDWGDDDGPGDDRVLGLGG